MVLGRKDHKPTLSVSSNGFISTHSSRKLGLVRPEINRFATIVPEWAVQNSDSLRWMISCVVAGCISSVVTIAWIDGRTLDRADARDGRREEAPIDRVYPGLTQSFDAHGLTPEEQVNTAVYEAVNRSVVNITSKTVRNGLVISVQGEGAGSGAVIDTDGHIVTNYHVVKDARQIDVALFNGETYTATRVGADPLNDLAVIKIDAPEDQLFPVEFGDSRQLKVGMRVFALGNPFGLERTLTTGIISSLDRSLQIHGNWEIKTIIQIDAAINPGSSGGPLLNAHGRLIGINTAIATTSGQSAGVGFAIPSSIIMRVVPQLLTRGRVIRPETGILNVLPTESGLRVTKLQPEGPAAKAGIRGSEVRRTRRGPFVTETIDRSAGDLIVAVDAEKVTSAADLLSYIEQKAPGDEVVLTVVRGGRKLEIPIVLSTSDTGAKE